MEIKYFGLISAREHDFPNKTLFYMWIKANASLDPYRAYRGEKESLKPSYNYTMSIEPRKLTSYISIFQHSISLLLYIPMFLI